MAQRIRLGLVFSYDESWIGGTYYILNLVHSLALLPDDRQPEIVVLCRRREDAEVVVATGYRHLSVRSLIGDFSFPERIANSISYRLRRKLFFDRRIRPSEIDVLFPATYTPPFEHIPAWQQLVWIPDFQERHLPRFFSEAHLALRYRERRRYATEARAIVFSSETARRDFRRWYASSPAATFVLNFAVHHRSHEQISAVALREQFEIDRPYFLVANQFWVHKNHGVVLSALERLRKGGIRPLVLFTGKEFDSRVPGYVQSLKNRVRESEIEPLVRFLGFIPRQQQLALMRDAVAVVQPSLFEGWSTVVEDCKAMGQYVLLSDLPVHREQLAEHVRFFQPEDDAALAAAMQDVLASPPGRRSVDYASNRRIFGERFAHILEEFLSARGPADFGSGRGI